MAAPLAQQHHSPSQLPSISSLTNGLPRMQSQLSPDQQSATEPLRPDSGTWPQPQSKNNSSNAQGLQVHTLLNPDDSPPRNSIPKTPQSARIPQSATSTGSQLPSINQGFHHDPNRDSRDYPPTLDSRRSSVDSRMHQTFNSLYINGPRSPYESNNTSQVSLAASLRNPNNGMPMSPLNGRSSIGRDRHPAPRVAPPIMPVGRLSGGPDPTASRPTQGYAWAFPDQPIPEESRTSDSDESSVRGVSRNNSFAASSIRSSIFSTDSAMPSGQRRFDDEQATTHHHTMQHRAVQNLQNEGVSPQNVGNYSRTPELRVSHKLAERKRRSEMKDLFEELNKAVPTSGGTKASKWEILSKAIEYIRSIQQNEGRINSELSRLQRDSDYGRDAQKENEMLKTEVQVMHQHLRRLDPNAPHVYGHFTSQLQGAGGPQMNGGGPGISLPPLNQEPPHAFNGAPHTHAAAMQGVEYGGYGGR
ncbi:hypothetical protein BAUCODRAFT_75925 [Baudoinia panamericana UAMH 10762]|uniref:BHLH domain-containing protein n=1 Tax=Baudoinia panamericana (strain UAMH 10762) TaxID=717646 RepID=M2N2I7_BAUPA|nr:uncharacterized protein BAUCODRAFT_75925 [Baudoinia panamericana UAMH 10762]EMC93194.1 hypothetical protein BAUCODRAFT_75925 [Baudoinia panamericana UAMH 10762]